MITYHSKVTSCQMWLDIALDGERVGYMYKRHGDDFYYATITGPKDMCIHEDMNHLDLEVLKNKVEDKLKDLEWADTIE